jgi:hypothetical protein
MRRTWGILIIALAFLLVYPFAYQRIPFLHEHFTSFNLLNGVMDKKEAKKLVENGIIELEPKTIGTEVEIDTTTGDTLPEPPPLMEAPSIDTSKVYTLLFRFFQALEKAEKKEGQARIFYFGDSMIEGDLITQTLRNHLQKRFGGEGVGWMPIASQTASFRGSVVHTFSDQIPTYSLFKGKHKTFTFGISGEVFPIRADSSNPWVRYVTSKMFATLDTFPSARFFYQPILGENQTSSGYLKTKWGNIELQNKDTISSVWITQQPTKAVTAEFHLNRPIGAYGMSLESKNGVILDNFSIRGTNGVTLLQIPGSTMRGFNRLLQPSLIVLQYGLNIAQPNRTNYEGYRIQMEKVIRHFQRNCPQASILVIGVADKGGKVDGELTTETCIPYILDAQRRAALNCGVAFFSLYDAMGGEGSMVRWVKEEKPALANLDFTHVNGLGAAKIAGFIHRFLTEGYQQYLERNP